METSLLDIVQLEFVLQVEKRDKRGTKEVSREGVSMDTAWHHIGVFGGLDACDLPISERKTSLLLAVIICS